jgi:hypothetical protein
MPYSLRFLLLLLLAAVCHATNCRDVHLAELDNPDYTTSDPVLAALGKANIQLESCVKRTPKPAKCGTPYGMVGPEQEAQCVIPCGCSKDLESVRTTMH